MNLKRTTEGIVVRYRAGRVRGRSLLLPLAALLLLVVGTGPLAAQGQEQPAETDPYLPISFGLLGGYGVNFYSGTVDLGQSPLIGGGTCGLLDGGGGNGVSAGPFVEYRLSPNFRIGLRGMLEDGSGVMTLGLPSYYHRLPSTAVVEIASEYQLDLDVSIQTVELYAGYAPFSFPLVLTAGPKIGIPSSPTFTFAEEIEGNEEVTFENGTTRQQYAAGSVDAGLLYGLHIGADYSLPMGDLFELRPGIAIYTYLNGLITGSEGPVISGIRPSLGLHYRLKRAAPDPPLLLAIEPTPPPPPPAPVAEPVALAVDAAGHRSDGGRTDVVEVGVEVHSQVREIPLLPYVFFDQGSNALPARYRNGANDPESSSALDLYRRLLDIVGRRMTESPGTITLTGTIDGSPTEKAREGLARERAESVGEYLAGTWGIDPDRISYETRGLPARPANPDLPGAAAENRRVEITTDQNYLDPWSVVDSTREVSVGTITFTPTQTSGERVNDWRLDVRVGDRSLRNVVGASRLPRTIDLDPTDAEVAAILNGRSIEFTLTGENSEGMSGKAEGSIPIRVSYSGEESAMLENARSLSTPVLFAYNSAELSPEARATLEAFRRRIPSGATLEIIGYADDLGGSEYNRALSRRRAEAVAALFPETDTTTVAAGEITSGNKDLTPEARYYARTVRIVVRTPGSP